LTGRYQQRFGHEFNPGPVAGDDVGLPTTEVTLPDRLKAAGYATGMVGKWHLGYTEKYHPINRGFQEFYGFLGGARSYLPIPGEPPVGSKMYRNREVLPDNEPYTTDTFAREAAAYIDRHAKDPWFLYLTFNAVHTPMHATDKYLARFKDVPDEKRRTYCAMMSAMDDAIGQVLGKLDELKLTENTLIFFVSDNGGPPVNASSNGVLRGNKAQTWEGGIRVPYLVQWKGRIPAGKTYDQPVIQLDFHSTALAAAGVEAKDAKLDGVNLLPYLEGQNASPPHDALYWRFGDQMAIRQGNLKLVHGRGAEGPMLFDLSTDIQESKDITLERPEEFKALTAKYEEWNKTLEKPRWGQPNRALGTFKNKANKKGKKAKATE
jgi:arylsulfatase A-like enzyme